MVLDRRPLRHVYILIAILLLPRLGTATVIAAIVVGQMLASATFDHFALLGLTRHPLTPARLPAPPS